MEPPAPRGRPRSPESDRAILEAALRLISTEGYARMSMDQVAAEAGVSKPTIYLRYDSKEDLATAALAHLRLEHAPHGGTDLRGILVEHLRHLRRTFDKLSGMSMLGTVLVEERHTPELLRLWRERVSVPYRRLLEETLASAAERGEVTSRSDPGTAIDMLLGGYYARYLSGEPFPEDWPEPLVDAVLASLGYRGAHGHPSPG
jgi:AcrR family transcriptional regulator